MCQYYRTELEHRPFYRNRIMTRRIFKSMVHRQILRCSLIGLAIITTLNGVAPLPVQANPWQNIRDFFRGDTGGRASGRSRGGATRDETCRINPDTLMPEAESNESIFPTTTVTGLEASILDSDPLNSDFSDPKRVENETSTINVTVEAAEPRISEAEVASTNIQQIIILAPEDPQKTTQANPDFFLYVPFDRNTHNMLLEFDLDVIGADNSRESEIDITLELPEKPGIVQFQLPIEMPLAVGKTYAWTFRLICQGSQPGPEPEPSVASQIVESVEAAIAPVSEDAPPQVDTGENSLNENEVTTNSGADLTTSEEATSDVEDIQIESLAIDDADTADTLPTLRQQVFGYIERVEVSAELAAALGGNDSGDDYEAYREHRIWFDMVSSLAAHAPSEWAQFLKEFSVEFNVDSNTDIKTTPQLLEPLNSP